MVILLAYLLLDILRVYAMPRGHSPEQAGHSTTRLVMSRKRPST